MVVKITLKNDEAPY